MRRGRRTSATRRSDPASSLAPASAPGYRAAVSSNVNWGDVPTWLATIAAIGGGGVALYQLALARRQLHEQQETIAAEFGRQAKRDELVQAQLKQIQTATVVLSRQQAGQVSLEPSAVANPNPANSHPSDRVWAVIVQNGSQRPIYGVEGWIRPTSDQAPVLAASLGKFAVAPPNDVIREVPRNWHSARRLSVIRSGPPSCSGSNMYAPSTRRRLCSPASPMTPGHDGSSTTT
jgi:hypothetical protein